MGSLLSVRFWDGTEIVAINTFNLKESYTDPLGSYSFTVSPPRDKLQEYYKYFSKGELIGIQVDGVPQATPIITTVNTTINMSGVSFNVQCKSVLVTPYQGGVDPEISKKFDNDTPVYIAILEALEPYNFDEIQGDDISNIGVISGKPLGSSKPPIPFKELKHNEIEAQNGETAYAFCSRMLSRLGAVLKVDWEGGLIISTPDYDQDVSYTLLQQFGENDILGNRMRNISIVDTNDNQFSDIIVRGASPDTKGRRRASKPRARVSEADANEGSVKAVLRKLGHAADTLDKAFSAYKEQPAISSVKAVTPYVDFKPPEPSYVSYAAMYKPLFHTDKKSRDKEWCTNVAQLIHGLRARDAFSITCEVDDLKSVEGPIWTVNTLARVIVEAIGLDEIMWVIDRELISDMNGQRAQLKLIPKGALVLGEIPRG